MRMRPVIVNGDKASLAVSLSEDKEKWLLWVNDREIQNMVNIDEILEELRKDKEKTVNFAVIDWGMVTAPRHWHSSANLHSRT